MSLTIHSILNDLGLPIGPSMEDFVPPPSPFDAAPPVLTGRHCTLEKFKESHVPDLFEAYQLDTEGKMWVYLLAGPFPTEEKYRAWTQDAISKRLYFFYTIRDSRTSKAVGVISLMNIVPSHGTIEIGNVCYSPLLQKTIAASECFHLLMSLAFDLGYRRVEWKCNALNAPSISAAHRLGFSFEGLFRNHFIVRGHSRDTAWFSLLREDWFSTVRPAQLRWLDPSNFDADGMQTLKLSDLTAPAVVSRFPNVSVSIVTSTV